jgi:hypothetical protein
MHMEVDADLVDNFLHIMADVLVLRPGWAQFRCNWARFWALRETAPYYLDIFNKNQHCTNQVWVVAVLRHIRLALLADCR